MMNPNLQWEAMKTLLTVVCVLFGLNLWAQVSAVPVFTNGVVVGVDFADDGTVDVEYVHDVSEQSRPDPSMQAFEVALVLRPRPGNDLLVPGLPRIAFEFGERVGPAHDAWIGGFGENYLTVARLQQVQPFLGAFWRYREREIYPYPYFADRTEALLGVRFTHSSRGTTHYGWVKLTRSNTVFTTPFQVVAHEWNPLPDQAIPAGKPPEIPVTATLAADGFRVSWPLDLAHWTLESAERLGPLAEWRPEPTAVGPEALLPFPTGSRFFRIRKP